MSQGIGRKRERTKVPTAVTARVAFATMHASIDPDTPASKAGIFPAAGHDTFSSKSGKVFLKLTSGSFCIRLWVV